MPGSPPQFLGRSELLLLEGWLAGQKDITVPPHSPKNLPMDSNIPAVSQGASQVGGSLPSPTSHFTFGETESLGRTLAQSLVASPEAEAGHGSQFSCLISQPQGLEHSMMGQKPSTRGQLAAAVWRQEPRLGQQGLDAGWQEQLQAG